MWALLGVVAVPRGTGYGVRRELAPTIEKTSTSTTSGPSRMFVDHVDSACSRERDCGVPSAGENSRTARRLPHFTSVR